MAQLCPFWVIPHHPVVEMSQYRALKQYLSTSVGEVEPASHPFRLEKDHGHPTNCHFWTAKPPLAPGVLRRHIGAGLTASKALGK